MLNSLELNDGPASYPVPALTVRNLITVKEDMVSYSEGFVLNVLDETGADKMCIRDRAESTPKNIPWKTPK